MDAAKDADYPILILIRGLPGSGKSYLANALKESIGNDKVVTLDPDATDYSSKEYLDLSKALIAEGVDAKFHPYRFLRSRAYAAITANKIIIWNQGFTNLDGFNKTVINLQAYASDHDTKLPLLVVEVEINPSVAKARVADRAKQGGHDVDEENFARFIGDYATFAGQGYDPVVVNGEDDVSNSVASVLDALHKLQQA
ncbi:MAG TPA: AAA family ATPase [Patescibacteria group bacterium]|nr:AAA family ATPase [Patescibacteria group bacterium]